MEQGFGPMSVFFLLFFQINAIIFTFILIKESLYHNKRYVLEQQITY